MEKVSIVQRRFGKSRSVETIALRRARNCTWGDSSGDSLSETVALEMEPSLLTPEVAVPPGEVPSWGDSPGDLRSKTVASEGGQSAPSDAVVASIDEVVRRLLGIAPIPGAVASGGNGRQEPEKVGNFWEMPVVNPKKSARKPVLRVDGEDDALLTTTDACRLLRVSKSFLYRKVQAGEVPSLRIGRYLRFRKKELVDRLLGGTLEFLNFLKEHDMPIPEEFKDYLKRIIIVDDDESMASSIQRILRRIEFETIVAHDGFQAGTLTESFCPRLMTLDLSMPGMSGLEVLKFIRNSERLKSLKVLVVSARPREELDQALAAGADDALEKPFSNHALIEKVCKLMEVPVPA